LKTIDDMIIKMENLVQTIEKYNIC
jgi:hypothetical protein